MVGRGGGCSQEDEFMARESQGLQVLLIVFVMLSVVLGVSHLPVRQEGRRGDQGRRGCQRRETTGPTGDGRDAERARRLKKLIGFPERSTEEIKKQFAEDMRTYGNERNDADKATATSRCSTPPRSTTAACSRA